MGRALGWMGVLLAAALGACSDPSETVEPTQDAQGDGMDAAVGETSSTTPDARDGADGSGGPAPELLEPVADVEAAAKAFRLYYKERVDRAVTAFNRYGLFGDVTSATVIGNGGVARAGDAYEIVPGPKDNNLIGTSVWTAWHAWKHLGTRKLELTLLRMFEGLVFFEQVSGHPGLTSREVYPGWTRVVDGTAGTVTRTRGGESVLPPTPIDAALEAEIVEAFFSGATWTYREDPDEFAWNFLPGWKSNEYAVDVAWSPDAETIIVSHCCSSLKRTPDDYPWAGAWWGNHNSRDNFPDLALGILAAMDAMDDPELAPEVRDAAARAVEAGKRIGDLIQASDGNIMTVDEHGTYDDLTVSGTIRPHGEPEIEDLGSMSACPMAYLGRAISSEGLALPLPELPLPGSLEKLITSSPEVVAFDIQCDTPNEVEGVRHCTSYADAYCGYTWETFGEVKLLGQPWFELIAELEQASPGTAEDLLGGFQNDFDDVAEAQVAVIAYARITGQDALLADAQQALADLTALMRQMADIAWQDKPDKLAEQRYESAIFDASAGLPVDPDDVGGLDLEEQRIAHIEAMLDVAETSPAAVKSDAQLWDEIKPKADGAWPIVTEKYYETFPDAPPVRVNEAGDGYEARNAYEDEWWDAEVPRHSGFGSLKLLQALPICTSQPALLDCTWAGLGCAAADVDSDGDVDADDEAAVTAAAGTEGCAPGDGGDAWCGGLDADHTGTVDATDAAFVAAARGCQL